MIKETLIKHMQCISPKFNSIQYHIKHNAYSSQSKNSQNQILLLNTFVVDTSKCKLRSFSQPGHPLKQARTTSTSTVFTVPHIEMGINVPLCVCIKAYGPPTCLGSSRPERFLVSEAYTLYVRMDNQGCPCPLAYTPKHKTN